MKTQIDDYLKNMGYQAIPSNLPEFMIYYQLENNSVNVIHLIDYRQDIILTGEQFAHVKDTIYKLFEDKGMLNVHLLSLILCGDMEKARLLGAEDNFCWIINTLERRLVIYENQTPDFYGLRQRLEALLAQPDEAWEGKQAAVRKRDYRNVPWVVSFLCAANIILFLICAFTGDLLYNGGMLLGDVVLQGREVYRMFTSMFLHVDLQHLFNNMVLLFFVGELIEKELGHIRTAVLYLGAGLAGNILSVGYDYYTAVYGGSLGASGAVFGLVGSLLFLVIRHKGKLESVTMGRIIIMIAYSLYSGFAAANIDNAAHIGGLIGGFVITFILTLTGPQG